MSKKFITVRHVVTLNIEVPEDWSADDVEFWRNESSWCATNLIRDMQLANGGGCICEGVRAEVVPFDQTKPFVRLSPTPDTTTGRT